MYNRDRCVPLSVSDVLLWLDHPRTRSMLMPDINRAIKLTLSNECWLHINIYLTRSCNQTKNKKGCVSEESWPREHAEDALCCFTFYILKVISFALNWNLMSDNSAPIGWWRTWIECKSSTYSFGISKLFHIGSCSCRFSFQPWWKTPGLTHWINWTQSSDSSCALDWLEFKKRKPYMHMTLYGIILNMPDSPRSKWPTLIECDWVLHVS